MHRRSFASSASPLADQMLQYMRAGSAGLNHNQLIDVLKGGLQMPGVDEIAAARLNLGIAEVEADRAGWAIAAEACSTAAAGVNSSSLARSSSRPPLLDETLLAARLFGTRAALAQGADPAALSAAKAFQEEARGMFCQPGWSEARKGVLAMSLGQGALAATAGNAGPPDAAAALATEAAALLRHAGGKHVPLRLNVNQPEAAEGSEQGRQALVGGWASAAAQYSVGLAGSAMGSLTDAEAGTYMERAEKAASAAAELIPVGPTPSPAPLGHRPSLLELRAGALLALGQLQIRAREFEKAEETLTGALKAAESVSGEHHARVGLVLAITAQLYAQTRRISFAEGLFREAGRLLKVPLELSDASGDVVKGLALVARAQCHPTAAAAVLYRYGQTLSMIANRKHHGEKLQADAVDIWRESGAAGQGPAEPLGDLFAGEGKRPQRALIDLVTRRLIFGA